MEKKKKGFNCFGPIWGNHFGPMSEKAEGNQDVKQLPETATLEINEANKIKELCELLGGFTESEKGNSWKKDRRLGKNVENGRNQ